MELDWGNGVSNYYRMAQLIITYPDLWRDGSWSTKTGNIMPRLPRSNRSKSKKVRKNYIRPWFPIRVSLDFFLQTSTSKLGNIWFLASTKIDPLASSPGSVITCVFSVCPKRYIFIERAFVASNPTMTWPFEESEKIRLFFAPSQFSLQPILDAVWGDQNPSKSNIYTPISLGIYPIFRQTYIWEGPVLRG